jgi:hypothetical protein
MNHLTDEQFEEIIHGVLPEPEHLVDCGRCRELLAEKTAIASRLRSAFASIKPDEQLVKNIRAQLTNEAVPKRVQFVNWLWNIRLRRIAWPVAAAAVLAIGILLSVHLMTPASAMAAQAELVKIHKHNLSAKHEIHSETDPMKLAEYFKSKLGFSPLMPVPGQGMKLRGCCVRHFRGQIVGSYVVDTPQGVISIIVVTDKPQSLGMDDKFERQGRVFWKSSFAKCDMVTVRLGDYSYCAVGEISHEYLTELLSRLMPET